MAKVEITDPLGQKQARVTDDNELVVSVSTYPAFRSQKTRFFRQYFTDDGSASGSNDMGIDGSVTNQEFWIPAQASTDLYISNVNLIVAYGTTGQPNQWANGTALTNGIEFSYDDTQGTVTIHDAVKTNQDMFRLSHTQVQNSWEVRHVGANNDYGYFITIDFESFMPPYGIKLDAGTDQKLKFVIKDNVGTDADTFNAIAYGFERYA